MSRHRGLGLALARTRAYDLVVPHGSRVQGFARGNCPLGNRATPEGKGSDAGRREESGVFLCLTGVGLARQGARDRCSERRSCAWQLDSWGRAMGGNATVSNVSTEEGFLTVTGLSVEDLRKLALYFARRMAWEHPRTAGRVAHVREEGQWDLDTDGARCHHRSGAGRRAGGCGQCPYEGGGARYAHGQPRRPAEMNHSWVPGTTSHAVTIVPSQVTGSQGLGCREDAFWLGLS